MKKSFKITLREGSKLSEYYENRSDSYKVVETDHVLGYVVSGGGRDSAAMVYPLYRADIHLKVGKVWHVLSSYERGERLNDYTFHADYEGCTFATIAGHAIQALEERRGAQQRVKRAVAKKRSVRGKGRA